MRAIKTTLHTVSGRAAAENIQRGGSFPPSISEANGRLGIPFHQRVFSIPEVQEFFGISRVSVYSLLNSGTLASFRIGNRRLVTGRAIEAAIAKLSEAGK